MSRDPTNPFAPLDNHGWMDAPDAASPLREQIRSAIRAFTSATTSEADQASLAILRIVRNVTPKGVIWPGKGYDHSNPGGFDGPTGAE